MKLLIKGFLTFLIIIVLSGKDKEDIIYVNVEGGEPLVFYEDSLPLTPVMKSTVVKLDMFIAQLKAEKNDK